MKLLIYGATGGTGSEVIEPAEYGYQANAFARSREKTAGQWQMGTFRVCS
jgi:hypothetical protein